MSEHTFETPDVTVVGGGLAGVAASLHLANANLRVACIEPKTGAREPVGESLDWATPALLRALGFSMEEMVGSQLATYKRGVTLKLNGGGDQKYAPSEWLANPPFHIELRTMHVDRFRLDDELMKQAVNRGVTVVRDKAVAIERSGRRITAVRTAGGARLASRWFIDASGSATSLFGREFQLPQYSYGPKKVAMWSYFPSARADEGTTIHVEDRKGSYLEWIWEIPINPTTLSVGYVTSGDTIRNKRHEGLTVEEIYAAQLARFPHFERLLDRGPHKVPSVTAFRCRSYSGVAGPNWLIAGEAASLADPITSNGVTAALRHASEAAHLITKFRGRHSLPRGARSAYSRRVLKMGRFFNSGIEGLVYDWPSRDRTGIMRAGRVYTAAAWSCNALYSRLKPTGVVASFAFGALLDALRASAWAYSKLWRRLPSVR
ncbi:MAG: tryptophan 7-halogenase [Bryobacteraceae bacterium]